MAETELSEEILDVLHQKLDVRNRVIATLVLLAVATVLLIISLSIQEVAWVANVACGLIVLGAAGIWVSFFAERQLLKSMRDSIEALTKGIDSRFAVLNTTVKAKVDDLYYDPGNARDLDRYRRDLLHELDKPRGEIRILAVAAREFLFRDEGFAATALESVIDPQSKKHDAGVSVRLALLHPCSEPAVTRALREHPDRDFDSLEDTNLWQDVRKSCITVCDWGRRKYRVSARLYKVAPCCFLVFVNDVLFAEFYHFGAGGRASGKVPLMRISRTSELYDELEGHFTYVWDSARCFALDDGLFAQIKDPDAPREQEFVRSMRFSRPDLFGAAAEDRGQSRGDSGEDVDDHKKKPNNNMEHDK